MQRLRHLLRPSVFSGRLAALVAAGALTLWSAKIVWLNALPEAFPRAAALGGMVESLLGNIVAACVFFLVFAQGPEVRARRRLRPYIRLHSQRVVGDATAILAEFTTASGTSLDFAAADEATLTRAMTAISTTTTHPNMVIGALNKPASWMQYLDHQRVRSRASIRRVLDQARFLDAEHVALLAAIDDSHMFNMVEQLAGMGGIHGHNLGWMASTAWSYLEQARTLDRYVEEELPG